MPFTYLFTFQHNTTISLLLFSNIGTIACQKLQSICSFPRFYKRGKQNFLHLIMIKITSQNMLGGMPAFHKLINDFNDQTIKCNFLAFIFILICHVFFLQGSARQGVSFNMIFGGDSQQNESLVNAAQTSKMALRTCLCAKITLNCTIFV